MDTLGVIEALALLAGLALMLVAAGDAVRTLATTRRRRGRRWPTPVYHRWSWRAWPAGRRAAGQPGNEPNERDEREYREKEQEVRWANHIPASDPVLFLEVTVVDPSEFASLLQVTGEERFGYKILRVERATVGNTIAAVLLHIRDRTGQLPRVYFGWTEGNPVLHLLRYLIFGDGDVPPITREVLRKAEPVRQRRPLVHVG